MLTVKGRIDVEGPEWKRVVYKLMRAMSESLNGRVKSRLAYSRLTWQGLENASIHASLVLMMEYGHSRHHHRQAGDEVQHSLLRLNGAVGWTWEVEETMRPTGLESLRPTSSPRTQRPEESAEDSPVWK